MQNINLLGKAAFAMMIPILAAISHIQLRVSLVWRQG